LRGAELAFELGRAESVHQLMGPTALSGHTDQALAVLGSLEELIGDTTAPGVLRAMALARATLADDDRAQQRFGAARELVPAAPP